MNLRYPFTSALALAILLAAIVALLLPTTLGAASARHGPPVAAGAASASRRSDKSEQRLGLRVAQPGGEDESPPTADYRASRRC